ncbi:hypothetical protein ABW19_dt0201580 [Dactylella cylindrospora]|nr:hypothetical protein ABW19_dt0201580 [Dactylella cylindrospora]
MTIPTVQDLLKSPYLKNFFLLFPFLFLGGLILFLLNRAESLRTGAGLQPPPPVIPIPVVENPPREEQQAQEVEGVVGDEDEEEDVDITEFLAEARGEVDFDEDGVDGEGVADDGQPGPAGGNAARPRAPRNRGVVGKKKARNLEIRDRRRAYNEFMQTQALERREREKALEEEMKEKIFEEKQRRALAEIKIEKQRMKEKAEKKEAEERNAKFVQDLKATVDGLSGCGKKTMTEERVLGRKEDEKGVVAFVTESGWLVRVGQEEISTLARQLEKKGKMSWEELGEELEAGLARL